MFHTLIDSPQYQQNIIILGHAAKQIKEEFFKHLGLPIDTLVYQDEKLLNRIVGERIKVYIKTGMEEEKLKDAAVTPGVKMPTPRPKSAQV